LLRLEKEINICSKCKTENKKSEGNCKKCGFKLKNFSLEKSYLKNDFVIGTSQVKENVTVFEIDNFKIENNKNKAEYSDKNEGTCHHCGYLLSGFSNVCPSCGYGHDPVKEKLFEDFQNKDHLITDANKTIMKGVLKNKKIEKIESKTIKNSFPSEMEEVDSTIQMKNFNITCLNPLHTEEKTDSHNGRIILEESGTYINRVDINPLDNSISNKKHVLIRKTDGNWLIENLASNKAVFLQINEPYTLKHGDIILLGRDNLFVFTENLDVQE